MDNLLREAADRATAYLHGLDGRSVFPSTSTVSQLKQFDGELPENLMVEEEVLVLLDEIGSPATVASAGGRYFGFVVGWISSRCASLSGSAMSGMKSTRGCLRSTARTSPTSTASMSPMAVTGMTCELQPQMWAPRSKKPWWVSRSS